MLPLIFPVLSGFFASFAGRTDFFFTQSGRGADRTLSHFITAKKIAKKN